MPDDKLIIRHPQYDHYSMSTLPITCARCQTVRPRYIILGAVTVNGLARTLLSCAPCGELVTVEGDTLDPLWRSLKWYGTRWAETKFDTAPKFEQMDFTKKGR